MGTLRNWSRTALDNATADATINWAEGQAASTVNNSARALMAAVANQYLASQWHWAEFSATASVASQTVFKLGTAAGDVTSDFHASRRVQIKGGAATRYGYIVSASYTSETTVTIGVDSGSLSASMSIVALGPAVTNSPLGGVALLGSTNTFTAPVMFTGHVGFSSATVSCASNMVLGSALDVSATASLGHLIVAGTARFNGSATFSGTAVFTSGIKFGDATAQTTAATGGLVKSSATANVSVATSNTALPWDDTIPQITEGAEHMTLAFTPTNTNHILEIYVRVQVGYTRGSAADGCTVALFQDATAAALDASDFLSNTDNIEKREVSFKYRMVAGTTSETTFRVRIGTHAGTTITFNGSGGGRKLGGILSSRIMIHQLSV